MSTGRRLLILGLAILPFLLAWFGLRILTGFDLVETNPNPFDGRDFKAVYASGEARQMVQCAEGTGACVLKGPLSGPLDVDRHGTAITRQGKLVHTPFWLPFSNPVVTISTHNPHFDILDTAGLLGEAGTAYQARQESTFILMDDILQSQASYRYGIFTKSGERAASAVYDATCGLLFRMQIKQPHKGDLRLLETDFPISRNRRWLLILYPLFALLLLYPLYRRDKWARETRGSHDWPLAWLVGLGMACLATDTLLDIWYPFLLGTYFPLAWHLVLLVPIYLLGRRACVPAVAEIVMALAVWIFNKGTVPTFLYIPGLTVSFILMLGMMTPPFAAKTTASNED